MDPFLWFVLVGCLVLAAVCMLPIPPFVKTIVSVIIVVMILLAFGGRSYSSGGSPRLDAPRLDTPRIDLRGGGGR